MKKYVKPELFYERYELTQHIADCQWEMRTNMDENFCVAYNENEAVWGDLTLFATEGACVITDLEDLCYHAGVEGQEKVFAS